MYKYIEKGIFYTVFIFSFGNNSCFVPKRKGEKLFFTKQHENFLYQNKLNCFFFIHEL